MYTDISGSKGYMCQDSEIGRVLIRKEALRFIVNLSSSISIKSSEQGLLRYDPCIPYHILSLWEFVSPYIY